MRALARDLRDQVVEQVVEHGEAVGTPPVDPGRFTMSVPSRRPRARG